MFHFRIEMMAYHGRIGSIAWHAGVRNDMMPQFSRLTMVYWCGLLIRAVPRWPKSVHILKNKL